LVLAVVAAAVYVGLPVLRGEPPRPAGYFTQLADAFLHGQLTIAVPPGSIPRRPELIPAGKPNRFYCPYPPLPAVLLMPLVLLAGPVVHVEAACRWISVLNVLLFDSCLAKLPRAMGRPPLSDPTRFMLTVLFAFGTAAWPNAEMGGDWHLAHAVALAAMLLALRESLRRNRAWLIGVFVGTAILSRPTTALSCLFFAIPLIRREHLTTLARLSIGPIVSVILLAGYNAARFGSALDFGYERMLLTGEGRRLMQTYGQFNPHFIIRNGFWFFLAPPAIRPDHAFPWLGYDPRGLSLFIASPALLYCLIAVRRQWKLPLVRHAAVAAALCLVPLLLYFNTGYWQFGHRFSMDYMPLLMVLAVAGVGPRPGRLAFALIALSVAVQTWGVLADSVARLPSGWVPAV